MDIFKLHGKNVLVTGGGHGIGFAMACALVEAGANLVFNDISQEMVDAGLKAYEKLGISARGYVCDVTDASALSIF
jgi:gluconate 5-dehydrogenase